LLIGAPQTSGEILFALLSEPSLVEEGVVGKVLAVQAAFGSPLVDLVATGDDAVGTFVARMFGGLRAKFSASEVRPRFERLVREARSQAGLGDADPALWPDVVYVVRSRTPSVAATALPFLPTYLLLRPRGANDAVTMTDAQRLPGLGTDLGVVEADHWDLFASTPFANAPPRVRRAFARVAWRLAVGG
jgi:hypothetical protein